MENVSLIIYSCGIPMLLVSPRFWNHNIFFDQAPFRSAKCMMRPNTFKVNNHPQALQTLLCSDLITATQC